MEAVMREKGREAGQNIGGKWGFSDRIPYVSKRGRGD